MRGHILITFFTMAMVFALLSYHAIDPLQAQGMDIGGEVDVIDLPTSNITTQERGPGDIVYVGNNLSTGAGIMIFRRDNTGRLTEMPNSPVLTGGLGLFDIVGFNRTPTGIFGAVDIGPFKHDANLILNKDRTRLFVVNQGSDNLSVFNISDDGLTLTPVPGSPFATGHVPASIGLAAFDTVIVVNKNDDPGGQKQPGQHGSIQTYKMAADGSLSPVPGSLIELPGARCGEGVFCDQTTTPSQVLVSEDGKLAFVNDFFAGMIRPYVVQPDGRLKATKPFDVRSLGPDVLPISGRSFPFTLGLGLYPGKNILYAGLLFENKVAVFTFNPKNGKLKFQNTAPNGGSSVGWFTVRKDGKYMWTSNQVSNSVSTYDLSDPLKPVEVQVVQFTGCGEPSQVAMDPSENWIYFVNSAVTNKCSQKDPNTRSNMIHTLRLAPDGKMTQLIQPDVLMQLPLGERIQGIATK